MKFREKWFVLMAVVLAVLFAGMGAFRWNPTQEEMFKWFDGLGYPDVKDKAFVRLEAGWSQAAGQEKVPTYWYGWVLKEEGPGAFEFLQVDLFGSRFRPRVNPDWKVLAEKADFAALAGQWLQGQKNADKQTDGMAIALRGWGSRLELPAQTVFLARVAALNGDDKLAADLYAYALSIPHERYSNGGDKSFKQTVSDAFAINRMWDTMEAFREGRLTHEQLRERMAGVVKNFPQSPVTPQAAEMEKVLGRMAKQEKARQAAGVKDITKLTGDAKARELIYQLRGQHSGPFSQPGQADVFGDQRGEKSPAAQLTAMGYDAVPALIEAMDDDSLTRSVTYHRDYYYSHHVLRVGDAAHSILFGISHRTFYKPQHTNGAMIKDGKAQEAKKAAQAWWAEVSSKGVKNVLREAVERGDDQSVNSCELLIANDPAEALGSIQKGYKQATEGWVREGLLSQSGQIQTAQAKAWLLDCMTNAAELPDRIAAARGLKQQDARAAVDAMIRAWESHDINDPEGLEKLGYFLAKAGDVKALEALGRGMERMNESFRYQALDWPGEGRSDMPTGAMEKAVEAFLIGRLDDMGRSSASGTRGAAWAHSPRIGDVAAIELAQRWPKKYAFDHAGTLLKRDQDRTAMMNLWLKENGKPERDMPRAKAVKEGDKVSRVIEELVMDSLSAQPDAELGALIEGLKGQEVSEDRLGQILDHVAMNHEKGAPGILLVATRDGPGEGFVVRVTVEPKLARKEKKVCWGTTYFAEGDGKPVTGGSGSQSLGEKQLASRSRGFSQAVEQAMKSERVTVIYGISMRYERKWDY